MGHASKGVDIVKRAAALVRWGKHSIQERFLKFVDRRGDDECWPWLGSVAEGRGRFNGPSGPDYAYRVGYVLFVRPLTDGEKLHHVCDNPICVNWLNHLEPTTQRRHILELTPKHSAYQNIRKTHCPRGHEYNIANTYVSPNGHRACRPCRAIRDLDKKARS